MSTKLVWRLAFGPAQRRDFGEDSLRNDGACGGLNAKRQTPNAKRQICVVVAFLAAMLALAGAQAADAKGYDAFKGVRTRNIFDPNRKAVRLEASRSSEPRKPRSSSFTLTGTMVREGRSLAFFSGSRSEFSKVISVGDSVANYKVTTIEPGQVELERDGKKLTLAIGKLFQIESAPGAPPEPDEPEEPAKTEGTEGTKTTDAAAPPAPPAGGDAKSETMRKMMEKRAKEMGK